MYENRLFEGGIYSVPEVARLVGTSPTRVRGWIGGYPKTKALPLLQNELGYADDKFAMSFVNLMEVRFIDQFSRAGVKVGAIRTMLDEAKKLLEHPHPFATDAIFKTDGKKIFTEVARICGDKALYDLKAKNWAMHDVISQSLLEGVKFDPHGNAVSWRPRDRDTPNVIILPSASFGQPILAEEGIPTRAIFDALWADGETEESVAYWFDISVERVKESVKFETLIRQAA